MAPKTPRSLGRKKNSSSASEHDTLALVSVLTATTPTTRHKVRIEATGVRVPPGTPPSSLLSALHISGPIIPGATIGPPRLAARAQLRELAQASWGELNDRDDRLSADGSPLWDGSFARTLPSGSPTCAAAAAHGRPSTGRNRSRHNVLRYAPRELVLAAMPAPSAPVAGRSSQSPGRNARASSGLAPPA